MYFVQFLLASAFEIAAGGWQRSSLRNYRRAGLTRSKATDLFFTVIPLLGISEGWLALATFGLSIFIGMGANRIAVSDLGLPVMQTGNLLADVPILYLVFSFFVYWNHRLLHVGPLWTLHRFHHSATEISLFNTTRHHPLQQAIERLVMVWPAALLGARPSVLFIVMTFHSSQSLMTHMDLPYSWGWFGRWVFQSPLAHRVHHAKDRALADRNFGNLIIWDHIFGTYAEPVKNIPVGIEDDFHNREFFGLALIRDVRDFAAGASAGASGHRAP